MDGYVSCKRCKVLVKNDADFCPRCGSSMGGISDGTLKAISVGVVSTFIAMIIFSIASCSGSDDKKSIHPNITKEQIASMLSGEEQIKDMMWDGGSKFLTLGLIDDGTDRSGYAESMCLTLKEKGFKENIHIKIIAIDKLAQTKEWVKIGGAECRLKD